MNKSLSLTALLFLAGPTLLTYGAQDDREREHDQASERSSGKDGLELIARALKLATCALERSEKRAAAQEPFSESSSGKALGRAVGFKLARDVDLVVQAALEKESLKAALELALEESRKATQEVALIRERIKRNANS